LYDIELDRYAVENSKEKIKGNDKRAKLIDFIRQKKVLDMAEIKIFSSLVLGYLQETLETIKQTFNICYELDIYLSVGYLLPQPGIPMYETSRQMGLIRD